MALDLPNVLQSVDLLSQTLLGQKEDELDTIWSQLATVESFEQYFPRSSGNQNAVLNTKTMDRFQEPVSKEEVKATQKAAIPKKIPTGLLLRERTGASLD